MSNFKIQYKKHLGGILAGAFAGSVLGGIYGFLIIGGVIGAITGGLVSGLRVCVVDVVSKKFNLGCQSARRRK